MDLHVLSLRNVALVAGALGALATGCDLGSASPPGASSGQGGSTGSGGASTSTGATSGSPSSSGPSTTGSGGAGGLPGTSSTSSVTSSGSGGSTGGLHVAGNRLVDQGKTVRLLGVDHSGSEYMCIQGHGIFDGPVDQNAVSAMLAWHANAVRLPLNEDCWLAINGAPGQYSGPTYQSAIAQYVALLRQNGLYVILDLHWNGGGGNQANGQQQMADTDHAPAFWASVASQFKGDQGVVFDLYNEPHDVPWACWLSGGCQANGWNVAGMQQLLDAVRGAGADNVVMCGGLAYASDLTQWLANKPNDPLSNLAASFHTYNFTGCSNAACWASQIQPIAAQVPVITGELGENDCAQGYIDGYMGWADSAGVSYLGWAWNADFGCNGGPGLISDWAGTPTAFGAGLQAHLALVNP